MAKLVYENKNFRAAALSTIAQANEILREYGELGYDLTLRQLYYQFVARGLIANRQAEYNKLGSIVNDARLAGMIDWSFIVDRTRNRRGRFHYHRADPSDAISEAKRLYAIDMWEHQPWRPEVWIEKDALVGVIEGVCWDNDVPYFSCRGYTSQSEMWSASQRFLEHLGNGQKVVIFHLGDHDPSGMDMTRDIEVRIWKFLVVDHWRNKMEGSGVNIEASIEYVNANFRVERLALHMEQVDEYSPPPNPAKLTDSRANNYVAEYGDESWELDALPPDVLAALIEEGLQGIRDEDQWAEDMGREEREKELLAQCSDRWEDVVNLLEGEE